MEENLGKKPQNGEKNPKRTVIWHPKEVVQKIGKGKRR